jgi:hypothetical protein
MSKMPPFRGGAAGSLDYTAFSHQLYGQTDL